MEKSSTRVSSAACGGELHRRGDLGDRAADVLEALAPNDVGTSRSGDIHDLKALEAMGFPVPPAEALERCARAGCDHLRQQHHEPAFVDGERVTGCVWSAECGCTGFQEKEAAGPEATVVDETPPVTKLKR